MIAGVVSMPSNIFATTGTNVSILFLDRAAHGNVVLIDASALGEKVKEGKNQKTLLSHAEEQRIVDTFNAREAVEDFSVVVDYETIAAKDWSLNAGQYFEVKIAYEDITPKQFAKKIEDFQSQLDAMYVESSKLEKKIKVRLAGLRV
jgi:type I restriction enzyme M protein